MKTNQLVQKIKNSVKIGKLTSSGALPFAICHFQFSILFAITFCAFAQLNAAEYEANDYASFRAAIVAINGGTGGDNVIKITGNITLEGDFPYIDRDFTITADANADGTPKFTIDGGGYSFSVCVSGTRVKHAVMENLTITNTRNFLVYTNDDPDASVVLNNIIHSYNDGNINLVSNRGKITLTNCISSYNMGSRGGGYWLLTREFFIENCTALNNGSQGFHLGGSTQNARAYINNCTVKGNSSGGVEIWAVNIIMNNCIVVGNGSAGIYLEGGYNDRAYENIISNTTVSGNRTGINIADYYGIRGASCKIINCTVSQNKRGINHARAYYSGSKHPYISKVYNSIVYGNECPNDEYFEGCGADLHSEGQVVEYPNDENCKLILYHTIYETEENDVYYWSGFPTEMEKIDCRTEDPKLQGFTMQGFPPYDPNELAYYYLDDGSSAIQFADKSLITVAELTAFHPDLDADVADWIKSIITPAYVQNMLAYDQLGNAREFIGNMYDAGAVSRNTSGAAILSYSPKRAANVGKTDITFYGYGFDEQMKVTLKRQGESDITAEKTEFVSSIKYYAVFDLDKKRLGKWDIMVEVDGETTVIKDGFELETLIEHDIEVEILGTPNIRNGSSTSYTVKYTNKGNVNVYLQPIIIEITVSKDVDVRVNERWQYFYTEGAYTDKYATIDGVVHRLDTAHHLVDPNKYSTYLVPLIPVIPPYHTGYLTFDVQFSFAGVANEPVEIRALVPPSLLDRATVENSLLKSGGVPGSFWECMGGAVGSGAGIGWEIAKTALGLIPGVGCAIQVGESIYKSATDQSPAVGQRVLNTTSEMGNIILACATSFIPMGNAAKTAIQVIQIASTVNSIARHSANIAGTLGACSKMFGIDPRLVGAVDPNDKYGPVNEYGSAWFTDRDEFTYVINFENDEKATAPAWEVWVTDHLDLTVFDVNTFEAGIIKIGGRIIETPPGMQNYTWTVDMQPEMDLITEIKLTLDKSKGIATWYFRSIDPATGELPTDALVGFLPPNDDEGSGQGFVMFTIKLKEGLANNVAVANSASIVFDNNEAIITDEWVNKKDIVPPTSAMLQPVGANGQTIELKWQGADNTGGSGIYGYDVYVKQGDGDYEQIFRNTTLTSSPFPVENGVQYAFYTIATDNAGNREQKSKFPDVVYPLISSAGINEITVRQPKTTLLTPNPAHTECTVAFEVEKPENISITLSNMSGARLMRIYAGYAESGRFQQTFPIGSLPDGVYIVTIHADSGVIGTEKLVVVK